MKIIKVFLVIPVVIEWMMKCGLHSLMILALYWAFCGLSLLYWFDRMYSNIYIKVNGVRKGEEGILLEDVHLNFNAFFANFHPILIRISQLSDNKGNPLCNCHLQPIHQRKPGDWQLQKRTLCSGEGNVNQGSVTIRQVQKQLGRSKNFPNSHFFPAPKGLFQLLSSIILLSLTFCLPGWLARKDPRSRNKLKLFF